MGRLRVSKRPHSFAKRGQKLLSTAGVSAIVLCQRMGGQGSEFAPSPPLAAPVGQTEDIVRGAEPDQR